MRHLLAIPLLGLLGAAALDPAVALETARKAVEARKPEDVLFALDGLPALAPEQELQAAGILARAAELSLDQKDGLLALQLCQMALRRAPDHADALSACATAAQGASQFDPAEGYVSRLRKAHAGDARGPLLAARLATAQGEWAACVTAAREAAAHKAARQPQRLEAKRLLKEAEAELASRQAALSENESLTRRIAEAGEKAARIKPDSSGLGMVVNRGGVVLYRTEWCGYCKKAEEFLRRKQVPFEEKDVETDASAILELAAKAAAQGIDPKGVPVIDVGGVLHVGFSEAVLEKALKKAGLL